MTNALRLPAAAACCMSLLMATSAFAHDLGKADDAYVGDSGGHLLTDGFGNCVQTGSWSKQSELVDCGAAPAEAAVEPEPEPVVAAVPVPAPVAPVAVSQAVALSAGALFDVNSADLKDEGKAELGALAAELNSMEEIQSIKIVGHTDNTGPAAYNQTLSERRAIAVKNYLLDQGITPTAMSTLGMGEDSPVASNATREGRASNRRVELTIEGTRIPQ